ncbi:uncharacterized protein An09g02970 [Aspergillus niger]|uniref:Contig An09c0070, genomic contig n=2 Tax=Aspergillus niger TaxID=5061 RepID=A2QTR1_ASPNC|nr:uncharacterized protein An09g02970 [Aspergillus niger]CAK40236.1 unnamed protein product [Aspergillus niger]
MVSLTLKPNSWGCVSEYEARYGVIYKVGIWVQSFRKTISVTLSQGPYVERQRAE